MPEFYTLSSPCADGANHCSTPLYPPKTPLYMDTGIVRQFESDFLAFLPEDKKPCERANDTLDWFHDNRDLRTTQRAGANEGENLGGAGQALQCEHFCISTPTEGRNDDILFINDGVCILGDESASASTDTAEDESDSCQIQESVHVRVRGPENQQRAAQAAFLEEFERVQLSNVEFVTTSVLGLCLCVNVFALLGCALLACLCCESAQGLFEGCETGLSRFLRGRLVRDRRNSRRGSKRSRDIFRGREQHMRRSRAYCRSQRRGSKRLGVRK